MKFMKICLTLLWSPLIIFMLGAGFFPSTAESTCPACLGSIGLPLRGEASTALKEWDFSLRYRLENQDSDVYYRKLQLGQASLYRNFDRWSLGLGLPISGAEGFMFDGEYHSVRSIYGADLSARYFILKAPLGPSRPVLSLIGGLKLPFGYVYHEGHDSPSAPWALTGGLGYSTNIGQTVLFGESYYSYGLKGDEAYSFGDRGSLFVGGMRFFGNRPVLGLGLNLTSIWQQGDKEPDHVDVQENTRRLTLEVGPRSSLLLGDLFFDASAGYVLLSAFEAPKSLPFRWSAEINLSYGF